METILSNLGSDDVLLGRGTGPNEHEGNKKFRALALELLTQSANFDANTNKGQLPAETRLELARKLVTSVQRKNGRFVRKLTKDEICQLDLQCGGMSKNKRKARSGRKKVDLYVMMPQAVAIEKAKQTFRHQLKLLIDDIGPTSNGGREELKESPHPLATSSTKACSKCVFGDVQPQPRLTCRGRSSPMFIPRRRMEGLQIGPSCFVPQVVPGGSTVFSRDSSSTLNGSARTRCAELFGRLQTLNACPGFDASGTYQDTLQQSLRICTEPSRSFPSTYNSIAASLLFRLVDAGTYSAAGTSSVPALAQSMEQSQSFANDPERTMPPRP